MNLNINKIKLLQARECLSMNELITKTGLGKATVIRALKGKGNATPKTIGLIAKALKVDVTEIVEE